MGFYKKLFLVFIITLFLFSATSIGIKDYNVFSDIPQSFAGNPKKSNWKQKEFIVTMWNASEPSISHYPQIAKERYNIVPVNYNALPLNDSVERLLAAKRSGLKVILGNEIINSSSLDDPIKLRKLNELIINIKKINSLEGYFIADEPSIKSLQKDINLVNYLREKDPGKLIYLNVLPTYGSEAQYGVDASQINSKNSNYSSRLHSVGSNNLRVKRYLAYLRIFVDKVNPDLISYDHYHLFDKKDGEEYFLNLALIAQVAKEANKPFLNIIQAGRYLKEWRFPTAQEVRFQVYTTLAYGGKGISYFTYWGNEAEQGMYRNSKASSLVSDVAVLNAELHNLSSVLMPLNVQGTYHSNLLSLGGEEIPKKSPLKILSKSDVLVSLFGKDSKTSAFMIANRSYRQQQKVDLKISLAGKEIQELDRTTGKWKRLEKMNPARNIGLMLKPGDGRLFRMK